MGVELSNSKALRKLEPFLVGEPKQFILYQGAYHCVRVNCEGCPHAESCISVDGELDTNPIENVRRSIGYEQDNFLLLKVKEGKSLDDIKEKEIIFVENVYGFPRIFPD